MSSMGSEGGDGAGLLVLLERERVARGRERRRMHEVQIETEEG